MSPAEKLREIVARAKGDDLERAQMEYDRYPKVRDVVSPHLEEFRRERAEWQAASDLLEELLKYAEQLGPCGMPQGLPPMEAGDWYLCEPDD